MASRNQRERRAPARYGVISIGILFNGENSDLELEEEEIDLAGEVRSSTNPVYNSSEEEVEEPPRKRRRRGREILNLQVFVSVPIHQKAMELTPTPYQICLQKIVAMEPLRVFQIARFSGKNLWEK